MNEITARRMTWDGSHDEDAYTRFVRQTAAGLKVQHMRDNPNDPPMSDEQARADAESITIMYKHQFRNYR